MGVLQDFADGIERASKRQFDDEPGGGVFDLDTYTGAERPGSDAEVPAEEGIVTQPADERGDGRWYWHRPLIDYSDEDVEQYLDEHDLEPAPVVQELGRSADCWCGAFGDRMELMDLEGLGYNEHAKWLRALSTPDDVPREQQQWAGYNWEKHDFAEEDDRQMTLCSSCDRAKDAGQNRQPEDQ